MLIGGDVRVRGVEALDGNVGSLFVFLRNGVAWRFIQYPNSLVAKVFKARYYPRGSFLDATLGSNPSFIWPSVLESQLIVKGGIRWRVGNGASISVWKDPWLPNHSSPFVLSPVIEQLNDIKVESLMNVQKTDWEVDILKDLFMETDVDHILKIPIAETLTEDKIVWMGDAKGKFTVRSCYNMLQPDYLVTDAPAWTKMWNFRLPPKLCNNGEESSFHLFVKCDLAKQCWDLIGGINLGSSNYLHEWVNAMFVSFDEAMLCKIIIICWSIWEARNDKVWNHKATTANMVVDQATIFLQEWIRIKYDGHVSNHSPTQSIPWSKPPHGWLKINVDAWIRVIEGWALVS
ncbi:uncharacterized protein LOC116004105 [Ipomoea triloba]|uniref:uncharacterized protein LOC116004105 n=1 Tax=Ipomoea triloba TaxID=35885 RepID=UPI00125D7C24|nr:uncharacterized protein LOC116004105 [Ipomoea triloba]